jgi:hypothetical protein
MNYPSVGNDAAVNDPNIAPMPEVIERALGRVLSDDPPASPYVVNFPKGMRRGNAVEILESIGDPRAELAALRVSGLPVYHIKRVWIRGSSARVEIMRPTPGEADAYVLSVVRLESRIGGNWRVTESRAWPVEASEAPPLYGWPGDASRNRGDDDASE